MDKRTLALVFGIVLVCSAFSFLAGQSFRIANASPDFLEVSISPSNVKLGVGQVQEFTATVANRDASYLPYSYSWTDSIGAILGTGQSLSFSFSEATNGTVLSVTVVSARGNQGYASTWVADPYTSASVYLDALQTGYVVQSDGLGWYGAFLNGRLTASSTTAATIINGVIASNREIEVLAGTYTITTSIIDGGATNVTLHFDSGAKLVANNALDAPVIYLTSTSNWKIIGVTIDGNAANQGTPNGIKPCGIETWDCQDILVSNAYIYRVRMFGVWLTGTASRNCGIINSIITYCGWNGITLGTGIGVGNYAKDNEVSHCSDVGITTYGTLSLISGNYVHDMDTSTGSYNSQWGISIEGGSGHTVSINQVVNVKKAIVAIPDVAAIANYTIIGNNIKSWDRAGGYFAAIEVRGTHGSILNNIMEQTNAYGDGIALTTGATRNLVSGNHVVYAPNSGVSLDSDSDYNTIQNNLLVAGWMAFAIGNVNCNGTLFANNDCYGSADSVYGNGTGTIYGTNLWHDGSYDNTPP